MNEFPPSGTSTTSNQPPGDVGRGALSFILESPVARASLEGRIIRGALRGPVFILDMGNCFNPLRLARQIRRQTIQVQPTLERIQVARAFTCYQVVALFEATTDPDGPVFILRLMSTFADEIQIHERLRLLKRVDASLDRLRRNTSVSVMVRNGSVQEEPLLEWLEGLRDRADEVLAPKPDLPVPPLTLF